MSDQQLPEPLPSPLTGRWWVYRSDGEHFDEYRFSDGGNGIEPDWVEAEEGWHDRPTEYAADRFDVETGLIRHRQIIRMYGEDGDES